MTNKQIADIFLRIADALEIKEENVFRIRAYRTAAQNITNLSRELSEIYDDEPSKLDNIPGIGKDLKSKIIEIITTGSLKYYKDLMKEFPKGFLDMLDLSGIGPKRLKKLKDELGIENVQDLETACVEGRLEAIEGMGLKVQKKLIDSIAYFRKREGRMLLFEADELSEDIIKYLKKDKTFKKITKAGSLRRGTETVGDIDILATASNSGKAMEHFVKYPQVEEIISKGKTKSSVALANGEQIDLRIVDEKSYGAALIYFTGSKLHNVQIRSKAKKKKLKINEYGVFKIRPSGKERYLAGRTEEEVYSKLNMQWVPPELREGKGEIDLAIGKKLPSDLVELKDIKGDLHLHTTESDGRSDIKEMVRAAKRLGYKYIGITDHSKHVKVSGGMDEKRLLKQVDKIRKIASSMSGIKILAGIEVDILDEGRLDIEDYALKELDIVIAAVHSRFSLSKKDQTRRILKAMDNKYVNVLAHPSGRLITKREPIELDFDKVFKKAVENNVFLEINTHGDRTDLNDINCARAKEMGARFVIDTDAHDTGQLLGMKYGVITARRGWLLKQDVLNTYSYSKVKSALKK